MLSLIWYDDEFIDNFRGKVRDSNEGLGHIRPDDISTGDDEYDAYRKRMMLAYRFRPNPLVSIIIL